MEIRDNNAAASAIRRQRPMAEEPDRLSELPDELLQHILRLAPCREAESTAALSRRWRGLWPPPTTCAVQVHIPSRDDHEDASLLRAAEEALAASRGPVERLAIDVDVGAGAGRDDPYRDGFVDVLGYVLAHPASRGAQDVRIRAYSSSSSTGSRAAAAGSAAAAADDDGSMDIVPAHQLLSFRSAPSAALRVLHITDCHCHEHEVTPPPIGPTPTFPCLEVLRLRGCIVTLKDLERMVAASPQLAALQLEDVFLATTHWRDPPQSLLCCPGITTLVLLDCIGDHEATVIELDVPRVQHFKYRGASSQFTLRSPLPDVRRTCLHIIPCYYHYHGREVQMCESFWNFVKNFSETEVLKLKLIRCPIGYVADMERRRIRDLVFGDNQFTPPAMFRAKHLEIDALYNPDSEDVGEAIGNLLQCCPALQDLRLKLNTIADHYLSIRRRSNQSTFLQSKAQMDFRKSIDHFRRRRDRPLCGDGGGEIEVSEIPGLSDRWPHLSCLRSHLKRLSLQFHIDKENPDCLGVRLVKFFVERGMALEEMRIDDGNMKLWEHMNCRIGGYAANREPLSEHQVLARMSRALSMNQQFSSSKISGWCDPHKLKVRRTDPSFGGRSFTILPLADR